MECSKCHAELDNEDNFCSICGQAVLHTKGKDGELDDLNESDLSFVRIIELFDYQKIRAVRPIICGYIVYAYLNSLLAEENLFEIIHPDNYFEYIYFGYEESMISVMSMFYSKDVISSNELNDRFLINVKAANFKSFQYPYIDNHLKPEDLLAGYLKGDIQDLMILSCIPFSIDLENKSNQTYTTIIDQFTMLPTDKAVFIEEATDHIYCRISSENKEVIKTVTFGEPIQNTELGLFVDANYLKYFELPSGKKIYF